MAVRYKIVRAMDEYMVGTDGSIWSSKTGVWKRLIGLTTRYGYQTVCLRINGIAKILKVHRLVLEAFVGPCPKGMECCHENGNRGDNRLSNLRWDTPKNNCADRIKHGTQAKGERQGLSKVTEGDVMEIRTLYASGQGDLKELGNRFGLTKSSVWSMVKRKTWKHVPQE